MTFHSPVILIAEHEDAEWEEISRILLEMTIQPVRARNGAAALGAVSKAWRDNCTPDMMLIDLDVPLLDALGVTRSIRTLGVTEQDMPIVALGHEGDDDEVAACVEAGMQWHLPRPVRAEALEGVIARWTPVRPERKAAKPKHMRDTIDAAVLPLVPAFVRRCEHCGACADRLLAVMPDLPREQVEQLCSDMHQLAGSSALFNEVRLGDAARGVEIALRALDDEIEPTDPAALHALLADFLAVLNDVRCESGLWIKSAV